VKQPSIDEYCWVSDYLSKTLFHSGALFCAYALTFWLITPMQNAFLVSAGAFGIMVYLPFGVKVLSAYFERWNAILYMAPGMFMANWLVLKLPFSMPINIALFAVSYCTSPAVFFVLDWTLKIDRLSIDLSRAWRILVVGSVIIAVLDSLVINLIVQQVALPPHITVASILGLIISDTLGLIAVLAILIAVFRGIHFLYGKNHRITRS
jgi:hypothetical protein